MRGGDVVELRNAPPGEWPIPTSLDSPPMTASPQASAPGRSAGRRTPDFFIVGNPKSGTTALYEMLRRHPQIFMPELKETRFFARELHPQLDQSDEHPHSLDEYLSLFERAQPEQRAGEASPSYLRSHAAAARIAELEPAARIIAILREPASFVSSLHLELLRDHVETEKDLGKAIALEEASRSEEATGGSGRRQRFGYADERVRYVEQLRRYHAVFGPEQVLVLIYDDFRADNEDTVRRVLRFLGVDDTLPVNVSEANASVRVRSPRTYELIRSLYLGRGPAARAVKSVVKALTTQRVRRDGLGALRRNVLYGKPRAADEQLMLDLRRRFKPEVVALSEYLDRDLVGLWGYDGLS
jgi:hypothetical protein